MNDKKFSNSMKLAAWCGIFIFIFSVIVWTVSLFVGDDVNLLYNLFSLIFGLFIYGLMIVWYSGFIVLGSEFEEGKLLKFISWIFIVILVIGLIILLIGSIYSIASGEILLSPDTINLTSNLLDNEANFEGSNFIGALIGLILVIFVLALLFFVLFLILRILFGVGLLKLGDKVPLAKAAGILEIVGACTLIIFVGIFVLLAAMVVEIIMFFKLSQGIKKRK